MRFRFEVNIMRLFNGHRSFFTVVQFGRRSYWLQRWDTPRSKPGLACPLARHAMTWTKGMHSV